MLIVFDVVVAVILEWRRAKKKKERMRKGVALEKAKVHKRARSSKHIFNTVSITYWSWTPHFPPTIAGWLIEWLVDLLCFVSVLYVFLVGLQMDRLLMHMYRDLTGGGGSGGGGGGCGADAYGNWDAILNTVPRKGKAKKKKRKRKRNNSRTKRKTHRGVCNLCGTDFGGVASHAVALYKAG